jgi:hypothetical protein
MRIIEITGEYRPCGVCKLGFRTKYRRGTTYAVVREWWGVVHVVPHEPDCPNGYPGVGKRAQRLEREAAAQREETS